VVTVIWNVTPLSLVKFANFSEERTAYLIRVEGHYLLFSVCLLCGLILETEDGSSMFLRNVGERIDSFPVSLRTGGHETCLTPSGASCYFILNMVVAGSPETLVSVYQISRRRVPEVYNCGIRRCENLKSLVIKALISVKNGEFLDWLSDNQLLIRKYATWN
jgi:hypothetical protein